VVIIIIIIIHEFHHDASLEQNFMVIHGSSPVHRDGLKDYFGLHLPSSQR